MRYSITPAEASKMVKKIMEEKVNAIDEERQRCTFNATLGEDVESVRPEYDYGETQAFIRGCDQKIRILKHALNCFNTTHKIGSEGITIDQALVYIPQLTDERNRLRGMQGRLPKQRASATGIGVNPVVDYRYANYSIEAAKKDYEAVSDKLRALLTALDTANTTEKLEFEFPD